MREAPSCQCLPACRKVRENNAASFLVVNAAFFTGIFTFAVFLGIVSDEVKSTFRCVGSVVRVFE